MLPVLNSIKNHAQEWKQVLGNNLHKKTKESMNNLKLKMDNYRKEVEFVISGLEKFKLVMKAISSIKKLATQAEVQYNEYQEVFRTLDIHNINYPIDDKLMSFKIQQDWESLYLGALYRSTTLESTFDQFCQMTKEQILDYCAECLRFSDYFYKHGPGSYHNDLDSGIKLMEVRKKKKINKSKLINNF